MTAPSGAREAIKCLAMAVIIAYSCFTPLASLAETQAVFNAINAPLYDQCVTSPVASTGPSTTSGSDNEQAIWNWLVGQGLDGAQAAGIMGNVEKESDFDPTIIQGGGDSNNPAAAGSVGWGLFQWTPGAKVLLDVQGAKATGSITAIATQMQIMWWEAQGHGQWTGQGDTIATIAAVSGNTDAAAEQVAGIFVNDFEHAGIIGPRGANADSILALAKQKGWTNANASTSTGISTGGGGTTTTGTGSSSSVCCGTPPVASALGTFSSLTGDQAISGTFILGFDASTNKSDIEAVFKKYKPAGMYILGTT
ncbi:MAG TPA: phage tail tip lysozyme, partial [Candidatus Saccharimonadia bacterium]|nr:phage tail tip lysozyme [Candidatus Saccharimonadia bacterium]